MRELLELVLLPELGASCFQSLKCLIVFGYNLLGQLKELISQFGYRIFALLLFVNPQTPLVLVLQRCRGVTGRNLAVLFPETLQLLDNRPDIWIKYVSDLIWIGIKFLPNLIVFQILVQFTQMFPMLFQHDLESICLGLALVVEFFQYIVVLALYKPECLVNLLHQIYYN